MKAIYKYRLPFMEVCKVIMPHNSEIIRIDGLDGALWIWAIVDTEEELVERTFHLFKTGGEMPDDIGEYDYLGCGAIFVQMELMMYVFEKPNTEVFVGAEPQPFDWKAVAEDSGESHAI
jgi:hypothetical protein